MAEYIERNKVYELIGQTGVAKIHVSDIDVIPAADVAPVRHGRWILDEKRYVIYCSECGEVSGYSLNLRDVREENHYCPNCGAKMEKMDLKEEQHELRRDL